MGLDIHISRKTASSKECLVHWHKFGPVAEWFNDAKKMYRLLNGATLAPGKTGETAESRTERTEKP